VPAEQRLTRATVDSAKVNNAAIVQRRSQRGTGLSGVAPDCPVPQEDKAPTVDLAPNPNGWVTWRRTGQCFACPAKLRKGLKCFACPAKR
jgi:hypothetical protein